MVEEAQKIKMDLYAHINGKDYPIQTGPAISDEGTETLDSGNIILPHVFENLDIKPYDDVIIHDYGINGLPNRPFRQIFVPSGNHFYKHLLVYQYSKQQVNLADTKTLNGEVVFEYNYTITLCSEIKGTETVPCPNRTITQPRGTNEDSLNELKSSAVYGNTYGYYFPIRLKRRIWLGSIENYKEQIDENVFLSLENNTISDSDNAPTLVSCLTNVNTEDVFWYYDLPDFILNDLEDGIGGIYVQTFDYDDSNNIYAKFLPIAVTKHWFIRKKNSYNDKLDREVILNKIHNSINGNDFSEWHYHTSSNRAIANQKVQLEPGLYDIYFYIDRKYISDKWDFQGNIIGMVSANPTTYDTPGNTAYWEYSEPLEMGGSPIIVEELLPKNDSDFLVSYEDINILKPIKESTTGSIKSIYEVARQIIELYSPFIKVSHDGKTWSYERKYSLSDNVKQKFSKVVCPEMSFNTPTLREILNKLFIVEDCIPVVHDGVIDYMSIVNRKNPIDIKNNLTFETEAMDGSQYADRIIRNYSQALSKDNLIKCVDRTGFRDVNSPNLLLSNLKIELTHPIYQLKKIYMCYYKQISDGTNSYIFLCRQDITPLVLLESQRRLLKADYYLQDLDINTLEDLSQFKHFTIGYNIGSNQIGGWGETFTYPISIGGLFTWSEKKSYIENIFNFLESKYPFGIDYYSLYQIPEFRRIINSNYSIGIPSFVKDLNNSKISKSVDTVQSILSGLSNKSEIFNWITDTTLILKCMFFEVEYQGFISSVVQASKDLHDGNVVQIDYASSSLSFLEEDGISEKEKVNRLGNSSVILTGRFKTPNDLYNIFDYRNVAPNHLDEIIYKRSYVIYKDYVTATFYLCKDYVLKNYYTSVYSRHRPFALASYSESVERKENKTLQFYLSKNNLYFQNESKKVMFDKNKLSKLFSFYKQTRMNQSGEIINQDNINASWIGVPNFNSSEEESYFIMDTQSYTAGYSLCFNVVMIDNASAGVFIRRLAPTFDKYVKTILESTFSDTGNSVKQTEMINAIPGALQDWYMFPLDNETGDLTKLNFNIGYKNQNLDSNYGVNNLINITNGTSEVEARFNNLIKMPNISLNEYSLFTHAIFSGRVDEDSNEETDVVFKDGKERINTTIQFEPISDSVDVQFSDELFKLSDLYTNKIKNFSPTNIIINELQWRIQKSMTNIRLDYESNNYFSNFPIIHFLIPKKNFGASKDQDWSSNNLEVMFGNTTNGIKIKFLRLIDSGFGNYNNFNRVPYIQVFCRITAYRNNIAVIQKTHSAYLYQFVDLTYQLPTLSNQESLASLLRSLQVKTGTNTAAAIPLTTCQDWISGSKPSIFSMNEYSSGGMYYCFSTVLDVDYLNSFDTTNFIMQQNNYAIDEVPSGEEDYQYERIVNIHLYYSPERSFAQLGTSITEYFFSGDEYSKKSLSKNMYWVVMEEMNKETYISSLTQEEFDNSRDETWDDNINCAVITNQEPYIVLYSGDEEKFPVNRSIRLYRFENNVYKFVFGVNTNEVSDNEYKVYISVLDNRSKKVLNAITGDNDYEIVNYLRDDGFTYGNRNDCKLK